MTQPAAARRESPAPRAAIKEITATRVAPMTDTDWAARAVALQEDDAQWGTEPPPVMQPQPVPAAWARAETGAPTGASQPGREPAPTE